ncbi:MAG: hypothetical protein GY896_10865 [Gammaproteobacteria bacterium]|nr:hypothetical protein [Gammaproteobacteria bacterium]
MVKKCDTGRNPDNKALIEAERVTRLLPSQQKNHPTTVPADVSKLDHINTYGSLPEYYIDQVFTCRQCGQHEIWKAEDQNWYYEDAKGHIDAIAVKCHACRKQKSAKGVAEQV